MRRIQFDIRPLQKMLAHFEETFTSLRDFGDAYVEYKKAWRMDIMKRRAIRRTQHRRLPG